MRTINVLPAQLVAKIAAGEVVERPASVVKELVENALDAGATDIQVELEDGGTKKIIVKDNGKGMSKEDIQLCFQPHTTSKISTDEDLVAIESFGFRGEALSSIAAVSMMTISSRQTDSEYGHQIELIGGKHIGGGSITQIGMPVGTEIKVESLFHSTPARKKFLKDSKTELRAVTELITHCALAFPAVSFSLNHNSKNIVHLTVTQEMHDHMQNRIKDIVGPHIDEQLIPVTHESRYGKVSGFISRPQAAEQSRNHQYIFINNRPVHDSTLTHILKESYGSLLEPRAYPPFILHFTLPYESVDVNVHPRKEEVAFAYPQEIQALIVEGIHSTLSKHNLAYIKDTSGDMDQHTAYFLKSIVTPWNVKNIVEGEIIQIHNLYLLTATEKGLLLIDQHAAHERILFEQFKEAFEKIRGTSIQHTFHQPIIFDLGPKDSLALAHHIEVFQKIGFDIEQFGKNTFKLAAVPEIFKERNHVQLITEVLHDIKSGFGTAHLDRETEKTLSYLACRSAIKAGDALEPNEQKKLVEKLLLSTTSYTCPHGRPTHIEITLRELDRMFKRH